VKDGKISVKDLFIALDQEGNGNGKVDKEEFTQMVKRLKMEFTPHRVNEIFANVKNKKLSQDNEELNLEEFEKAMTYVNEKKAAMSLDMLELSPSYLTFTLGYMIVTLALLLIFIFLGIEAFSIGGSFGAVINSLIPCSATVGASAQSGNKGN